VEDRGDIMAKSRKILGCLSCLPSMQRGQGQILSLLFWELFEEHLNNLYRLILQINIGFFKKKHSKIGIDIFLP
jgi:hypothetical protein